MIQVSNLVNQFAYFYFIQLRRPAPEMNGIYADNAFSVIVKKLNTHQKQLVMEIIEKNTCCRQYPNLLTPGMYENILFPQQQPWVVKVKAKC